MPPFISSISSSSIASTKPTLLNRREDNARRRNQRSSSWSGWVPSPLLRKPSGKTAPARSSSLGREAGPRTSPSSAHHEAEEKRRSFRRWGKRRDKKSVTFEEDTGLSLKDFDSASGTVRRQKISGKYLASGIFPRAIPVEERSFDLRPTSQVDLANHAVLAPGACIEGHAPSQEKGDTRYWTNLRRQLEEKAKSWEERHRRRAIKKGRKEQQQGTSSHQRTVSRDDQLTARGANPRTGVISPSILSGGSKSGGSRDSQDGVIKTLPKWRLKGNEWVSLGPGERSPLPSPSGDHIAQPQFPDLQRIKTEPVPSHMLSPLAKSHTHPALYEDKFVVNMPSAREPSPLAMTTQQIVDYQKTIERVHRKGGQMLDPDALPTPRTPTPTGLSTPPRRLTKHMRRNVLGRKRGATLPPSPRSSRQWLVRNGPRGTPTGHDRLPPDTEVARSNGYLSPTVPASSEGMFHETGGINELQEFLSQQDTSSSRNEPFLGQAGELESRRCQMPYPRTADYASYPSPQRMKARGFAVKKLKYLQKGLTKLTAEEEKFLRRSQPGCLQTKSQAWPNRQILSCLPRKFIGDHAREVPLTQAGQEVLDYTPHPKQENLSTTITTTTPTFTSTNTTSTDPSLVTVHNHQAEFNAPPHGISLNHSGDCLEHRTPSWSETSTMRANTLNVKRPEQGVDRAARTPTPNRALGMYGSTPTLGNLGNKSDVHFNIGHDRRKVSFATDPESSSRHSSGTWTRDMITASRCQRLPNRIMELDRGNLSPTHNHAARSDIKRKSIAGVKDSSYNNGTRHPCNSDSLTSSIQFFEYIARDRHTMELAFSRGFLEILEMLES
ncbi:hypothetical protein AJ79_05158 [Helicocarpus griseus UAMH5409]|uniref:Uncharacterized protein n=1 Tax=Helicocarpus griseus UAMH5409 TaxID=1447875 RepID=A0A2B7XR76_9EURO|nr:hypothetical protein AJ79_05158 [Helicocarpus griseus UAMH5409]